MSRKPKLTYKRLTELLNADPASGWKIRPSNRVHVGDRAGVFHYVSGGLARPLILTPQHAFAIAGILPFIRSE